MYVAEHTGIIGGLDRLFMSTWVRYVGFQWFDWSRLRVVGLAVEHLPDVSRLHPEFGRCLEHLTITFLTSEAMSE